MEKLKKEKKHFLEPSWVVAKEKKKFRKKKNIIDKSYATTTRKYSF